MINISSCASIKRVCARQSHQGSHTRQCEMAAHARSLCLSPFHRCPSRRFACGRPACTHTYHTHTTHIRCGVSTAIAGAWPGRYRCPYFSAIIAVRAKPMPTATPTAVGRTGWMLPMAPGTMANTILNNVATWTMNPVRNPGNVRQDSGNKLWLTSCRLPHGAHATQRRVSQQRPRSLNTHIQLW